MSQMHNEITDLETQVSFWRERAKQFQNENGQLQMRVVQLLTVIKEYQAVREMLHQSGDDPLDYDEFWGDECDGINSDI